MISKSTKYCLAFIFLWVYHNCVSQSYNTNGFYNDQLHNTILNNGFYYISSKPLSAVEYGHKELKASSPNDSMLIQYCNEIFKHIKIETHFGDNNFSDLIRLHSIEETDKKTKIRLLLIPDESDLFLNYELLHLLNKGSTGDSISHISIFIKSIFYSYYRGIPMFIKLFSQSKYYGKNYESIEIILHIPLERKNGKENKRSNFYNDSYISWTRKNLLIVSGGMSHLYRPDRDKAHHLMSRANNNISMILKKPATSCYITVIDSSLSKYLEKNSLGKLETYIYDYLRYRYPNGIFDGDKLQFKLTGKRGLVTKKNNIWENIEVYLFLTLEYNILTIHCVLDGDYKMASPMGSGPTKSSLLSGGKLDWHYEDELISFGTNLLNDIKLHLNAAK